jgi:Smg protein
MTESQGSVLDILIYVFDRYMLTDTAAVPERDELALDLERQGFSLDRVEQALDWLADLAGLTIPLNAVAPADPTAAAATIVSAGPAAPSPASVRVFTASELERLSVQSRGYLYTLERIGILSPRHRELVIERLLALEHHAQEPAIDVEQLKWVVLMVLSSQPGEELACSRMEGLVFDEPERLH